MLKVEKGVIKTIALTHYIGQQHKKAIGRRPRYAIAPNTTTPSSHLPISPSPHLPISPPSPHFPPCSLFPTPYSLLPTPSFSQPISQ
ncbi:hypothetical protein [Moorena producens]|uniref:hypothetical protein n=1 Tax=Moorena producens TaxID=1155739 RepID=UPI000B30372F|nr:hypothetical protein [Moorena producens]